MYVTNATPVVTLSEYIAITLAPYVGVVLLVLLLVYWISLKFTK